MDTTLTITRHYTDAYGQPRLERIPARRPIVKHRSRVLDIAHVASPHTDYVSPLGAIVFMVRAIHEQNPGMAGLYRDVSLRDSAHRAHVIRLWNLATFPRPHLP